MAKKKLHIADSFTVTDKRGREFSCTLRLSADEISSFMINGLKANGPFDRAAREGRATMKRSSERTRSMPPTGPRGVRSCLDREVATYGARWRKCRVL